MSIESSQDGVFSPPANDRCSDLIDNKTYQKILMIGLVPCLYRIFYLLEDSKENGVLMFPFD